MHRARVITIASAVALALGARASTATAQSRRFDVRLSLGVAPPPLTGILQQSPTHFGLVGSLGFEYRVVRPLAIELQLAAAYFPVDVSMSTNLPPFAMDASAQLGLRVFPVAGLFLAARGGVHTFLQELRGGLDVELGYDFAPVPAFTIGPFARGTVILGTTPERPTEAYLVFGITLALGPVQQPEPDSQHADEPASTARSPRTEQGIGGSAATTGTTMSGSTAVEDGDRDGVPDDRDRCPGSPLGATGIGPNGCTESTSPAAQTGRGQTHHHPAHRRGAGHRRHH